MEGNVSGFVFSLASLLRYRRHRRDLCRQLLAEVLADEQRLHAEQRASEHERRELLAEIRELGDAGPVDIDRSAARRYYAAQLSRRIAGTAQRRQLVAGQLDLCRQALTRADGEVRMLERLEETRRAEHRYQEDRRAERELEDAWNSGQLVRKGQS
jgi:flagellar protein FliJ